MKWTIFLAFLPVFANSIENFIACYDGKNTPYATHVCPYSDGETLVQRWDATPVLFSIMEAIMGSYITIMYIKRLAIVRERMYYKIFVIMSGISFGFCAVWTMHFIGMKALVLGDKKINIQVDGGAEVEVFAIVELQFEGTMTIISLVAAVSVAVTLISIRDLKSEGFTWGAEDVKIVKVAIGLAVAVGVMHYLGMWAQSGKFNIHWNGGIIFASVLLALVVVYVGLKILFTQRIVDSVQNQMLTAVVIGLAVCSVHYTGMQSATYTYKASGYRDTAYSIWVDDFGSSYFLLSLGIIKFVLGLSLHSYDMYIKSAAFDMLEKELYDRCHLKMKSAFVENEDSRESTFITGIGGGETSDAESCVELVSPKMVGSTPATPCENDQKSAFSIFIDTKKDSDKEDKKAKPETKTEAELQCPTSLNQTVGSQHLALAIPNQNLENTPSRDISPVPSPMPSPMPSPTPKRRVLAINANRKSEISPSRDINPMPSPTPKNRALTSNEKPVKSESMKTQIKLEKKFQQSSRRSKTSTQTVDSISFPGGQESSNTVNVVSTFPNFNTKIAQSMELMTLKIKEASKDPNRLLKMVRVESNYSIDIMTLINIYKKQKKQLCREIQYFQMPRFIRPAVGESRVLSSLPSKIIFEQTRGWKIEQNRLKKIIKKQQQELRRRTKRMNSMLRRSNRSGSRNRGKGNKHSRNPSLEASMPGKSLRASIQTQQTGNPKKVQNQSEIQMTLVANTGCNTPKKV